MQTFAKVAHFGLVGVALTLAAQGGSANASPRTESPSKSEQVATAKTYLNNSGTLIIHYKGQIVPETVQYLSNQFEQHRRNTYKIVLALDSPGGNIEAGERVINLLNRIKLTHRLATMVQPGEKCASMCVPIFLQGQQRIAARTSAWMFHEAASPAGNGRVSINREETLRIFRRYFIPAGVSPDWLKDVANSIAQSNVWQTGQDLIESKSGIITHAINNQQPRPAVAPKTPPSNTQASSGLRLRFLQ